MLRLIIILVSTLVVFYFFRGVSVPGSEGGPNVPPSRQTPPTQTAQVTVQKTTQPDKPDIHGFNYTLGMTGQPQPVNIHFELSDAAIKSTEQDMPLFNSSDIKKLLAEDASRIQREIDRERDARLQQVVNIVNRDVFMKNGVTLVMEKTSKGYKQRFQYWKTHQNKETLEHLRRRGDKMFEGYASYRDLFERSAFVDRQTHYLRQYLPYENYSYDLDFDFEKQDYVAYLRPDFSIIARTQRENLYPLARALFEAAPSKDPRDLATMALTFVQSIPPDPKDRQRNLALRNTPFVTPTAMLVQNRGSADTKATTLASLLGILLPDYTVVVYLLPEHAVIGLNLHKVEDDFTHRALSGATFVLMEPYGPGLMPVGQVSEYTKNVIDKGVYSYFVVPQ